MTTTKRTTVPPSEPVKKDDKGSVTSHTAPKDPWEALSESDRKRMMTGYIFSGYSTATPREFLNGGKNRPDAAVWGIHMTDLTDGIKGAVIPPLAIWEAGGWLMDLDEHLPYDLRDHAWLRDDGDFWCAWMVDGQGTPGGHRWRIYFVPDDITKITVPKHPAMWKKALKEGNKMPVRSAFISTRSCKLKPGAARPDIDKDTGTKRWEGSDRHYGDDSWPTYGFQSAPKAPVKPATPPPVKSTLPAGVRFQCPTCGHWYRESNLAGHAKLCPGIHGLAGVSGWAVLCEKECGCEYLSGFPTSLHQLGFKTFDHVSRCKPGFEPKPKEEVKMTEAPTAPVEGEEKPEGEEEETTPEASTTAAS